MDYQLPSWAMRLQTLYWVIRVEGRMPKKRRRYYRLVQKEKIRLAEMNICQHQIKAACLYLSNPRSDARRSRFFHILKNPHPQKRLDF